MTTNSVCQKELAGFNVIVTGGSRGIGRAISREFARNGANVFFVHHQDVASAKAVLTELRTFDIRSEALHVDVSDHQAIRSAFSELMETYGPIRVLVNCAGITLDKTISKLSFENWNRVLATNLTGCFNCTQAVLDKMRDENYGRIINISSVIAQTGNVGQTNYAASKGGVISFTKALALETARYDITVNAICPGFIETSMLSTIPQEIKQKILNKIPKGRFGLPEEIGWLAIFLASPRSSYITGQTLNINGGLYM